MTHGGGGVAAAENQGAVEGGAGLPAQDVGQLGATSPVRLGNVQVGNAALADRLAVGNFIDTNDLRLWGGRRLGSSTRGGRDHLRSRHQYPTW